MSQVLARLNEKGLKLPELQPTQAAFKPFVISGNHVYISGQLPLGFGDISSHAGQVGDKFNIEQAQKIAQICGLNVLFHLRNACGGNLDKIKKCVKLTVFVNSTPSFTDQPKVANAVSELMVLALGEKGEHARSAIGVAQLPLGVAVEVEAIFEL